MHHYLVVCESLEIRLRSCRRCYLPRIWTEEESATRSVIRKATARPYQGWPRNAGLSLDEIAWVGLNLAPLSDAPDGLVLPNGYLR